VWMVFLFLIQYSVSYPRWVKYDRKALYWCWRRWKEWRMRKSTISRDLRKMGRNAVVLIVNNDTPYLAATTQLIDIENRLKNGQNISQAISSQLNSKSSNPLLKKRETSRRLKQVSEYPCYDEEVPKRVFFLRSFIESCVKVIRDTTSGMPHQYHIYL